MKEEQRNLSTQLFIFCLPLFLGAFLVGILKIGELKFLFLLGPLGLALFHFRGRVWYRNWYSKIECLIWGIGWLIFDFILFYIGYLKKL